MNGGFHPLQLVHEGFIHMETAGGIQKDQIVAVIPGVVDGVFRDFDGIALPLLVNRKAQLSAHHLQLFNGGGPVYVAGGQQGPLAVLLFHIARQLGGGGGFTGALKAHHHYHCGAVVGQRQLGGAAAHEVCQFLIDDFHHLLGRSQAVQHIGTHGPFRHGGHEFLDHLVAYVSLQQRQTDFPHGLPDVVFRQAALAPQALKGRIQFFTQSLKCHGLLLQRGGFRRDFVRQLRQAAVLILPVVQHPDFLCGAADGVQMAPELLKAADQAGLVLNLLHGGFSPDDDVPDALTGDPLVFGNLRQGEILIIIEIEELFLTVSQEFAVEIKEHCHAIGLIFHAELPFCKVRTLYNSIQFTGFPLKSQGENGKKPELPKKIAVAAAVQGAYTGGKGKGAGTE